jgi:hypothetical protein
VPPNTDWKRCVEQFYRYAVSHMPNVKVAEVARKLKAILTQEKPLNCPGEGQRRSRAVDGNKTANDC